MGPIPDPKTLIFFCFFYITPDIPLYGGPYVRRGQTFGDSQAKHAITTPLGQAPGPWPWAKGPRDPGTWDPKRTQALFFNRLLCGTILSPEQTELVYGSIFLLHGANMLPALAAIAEGTPGTLE